MSNDLPPQDAELVEVFSSLDVTQVQIAHELLTEAGIENFIFDEESSRMLGSTAAVPARLMVPAGKAEEATSQLKQLGFQA
jgi:hypothetical protein